MNDTPPEIAEKYRQMLLSRSGEERLRMGSSMNATARALVRASVLARDPQASPGTIRRELFLRFYGHEFDAEERERIAALLGRGGADMTADHQVRFDINSLLDGEFSRFRTALARTVTGPPFGWGRLLGKTRGGDQTLLAHALSVLDTLAACLPFVAEQSYPRLTHLEVQGLLLAAFVHDAGKASEPFQAHLREEGPWAEHVAPETIRSLATAAAREAGIDMGTTIDDVVSLAVLHDRRMRRDRGELTERERKHESLRWRKLADLVDAADSLASSTVPSEAEVFLARNRQLVAGADVAAYQVRVRGVSTTFLHSAALDAFREAGWTPVRYFEDGTVFVGRGARPVDQHAVRRVLEARLTELVNARADQVSVLAIGAATKDFLPAPEYVTEQNIDHLFDEAASRVRSKAKIGDSERQRWSKQWVDEGLPEHDAVKAIFQGACSDRALEMLASSGPEICLLKLFKNVMDPAKGLCDATDERTARRLYEACVPEGSYGSMRQQSTFMLVKDYKLALAAWHALPADGALGNRTLHLADLDPKARQRRIREELIRITRKVFAARRARGVALLADRLPSEWAGSILADLSVERTGLAAESIRQNLAGYAALKATVAPRGPKPPLQCAQCADTIEPGAEEEPSDALGNIASFSNRRVAFDTSGNPAVCPTCTVDLKLSSLCLGGRVRTVIGLVPPRGMSPSEAAHLLEIVQNLKGTVDRQLSPETLDPTRYVALSFPQDILRQERDRTLLDRMVLRVSEKTIKDRGRRLADELSERLGGDEGIAELGRDLQVPVTSVVDLAKALVEGTAPQAIRDDPDVAAALRHAQRDVLVEFGAVTPNLVVVALDRQIAADREADRALYQFGLAALFSEELGVAALVASPGELRTAVSARRGRAVYVPSNGPARRLLGGDWLSAERAGMWARALQAAIALGPSLGGDAVGPYGVLRFPGAGFVIRRVERMAKAEPYWPTLWTHIEALREVLG